jgi:RNA polymerase sigma-70 factor (ECF subfamily)
LRKNRRTEPIEEVKWRKVAGPGLQPDEHAEHRECMERIGMLLDRLSENQREVIILKFQQGLSYEEIAKITGLSSGNIGFLIHTGLKRIRDLLPEDLKPEPRNHSQ